jgi:hypothetical protein
MGASLNVNLSQTGVNETSRTATVSVVVTITSNAGTHNHFGSSSLGIGAYLSVTIDGSSYEGYVTFGSEDTGTYTSTVYSSTETVSYGSSGTKTVFASATCVTGTSAGTISGSDSLTLTPIASSGGGGSDSGDDDDDYTGGSGSGSGTTSSLSGIVISNGATFDEYRCHIDTHHEVTKRVECSCSFESMNPGYRFVTPSDLESYDAVYVLLTKVYAFVGDGYYVNLYVYLRNTDGTLLDSKSKAYESNGNVGNVGLELRPSAPLEPNTEYRIFIAGGGDSEDAEVGYDFDTLTVTGNHTGMVDEYLEYEPYIDNGTGWDLYT